MQMKEFKKINKCRLCNSTNLNQIISFGKVPLGNNLQRSKKLSLEANRYPLGLSNCCKCEHYQLTHEVSSKLLYATNYTYLTGISSSFIDHFKEYVDWVEKKCKLKRNAKILDIGSNDGTCLKAFKKKKFSTIGIDPAKLPSQLANKNKIKTYNYFFNSKSSEIIFNKEGKFDFITSHNVFAHIDNLQLVFKNIFFLLKEDGYLCFEIGYFIKVMQNNLFDTIYHEHLDYHHAAPLIKLLKSIGFSIIEIKENKIQGGSLRILCKKEIKPKQYRNVNFFLKKEDSILRLLRKKIRSWDDEITSNLKKMNAFINSKLKKGFTVAAYGAPTKATLLLKLSKLDGNKYINYVVEDNHLKIGRYLPGTSIKIVNFSKLKKNKPDIIVILAWNFLSDIIIKLVKNKIDNVQLIVPMPKFKKINL